MDRFGFRFWLGWICWFAGSFVLAAAGWTVLIEKALGPIEGSAREITWAISVFGTWFILVIPFMRKKERVWKRLNTHQEKAVDAWQTAMMIFIGALIGSLFFWSWRYREELGGSGIYGPWVKAVLVTWLVVLLPFLILMYRRADQIFRDARQEQAAPGPQFRARFYDKASRQLPGLARLQLEGIAPTVGEGHVVSLRLRNGSVIPHVFILHRREILGIYDAEALSFSMEEIEGVEVLKPESLPPYEEARWLRLDGRRG